MSLFRSWSSAVPILGLVAIVAILAWGWPEDSMLRPAEKDISNSVLSGSQESPPRSSHPEEDSPQPAVPPAGLSPEAFRRLLESGDEALVARALQEIERTKDPALALVVIEFASSSPRGKSSLEAILVAKKTGLPEASAALARLFAESSDPTFRTTIVSAFELHPTPRDSEQLREMLAGCEDSELAGRIESLLE